MGIIKTGREMEGNRKESDSITVTNWEGDFLQELDLTEWEASMSFYLADGRNVTGEF